MIVTTILRGRYHFLASFATFVFISSVSTTWALKGLHRVTRKMSTPWPRRVVPVGVLSRSSSSSSSSAEQVTPSISGGGGGQDEFRTPFISPVRADVVSLTSLREPKWKDLRVPPSELRVGASLSTGQCFNWRPVHFSKQAARPPPRSLLPPPPRREFGAVKVEEDSLGGLAEEEEEEEEERRQEEEEEGNTQPIGGTVEVAWVGVLGRRWVVAVAETPTTTLYACLTDDTREGGSANHSGLPPSMACSSFGDSAVGEVANEGAITKRGLDDDDDDHHDGDDDDLVAAALRDYFQLGTPLAPLRSQWCLADGKRLKVIADCIPGLRVLRQDPVECLFSFIVSSNNNLSRITLILNAMREAWGDHLLTLPAACAADLNADDHVANNEKVHPTQSPLSSSSSSSSSLVGRSTSTALSGELEKEDDEDEEGVPKNKNKKRRLKNGGSGDEVAAAAAPPLSPTPLSPSKSSARSKTVGAALGDQHFYSFPRLEKLADASEEELRGLGLGYRARFVKETATALLKKTTPTPPSCSPSSSSSSSPSSAQKPTRTVKKETPQSAAAAASSLVAVKEEEEHGGGGGNTASLPPLFSSSASPPPSPTPSSWPPAAAEQRKESETYGGGGGGGGGGRDWLLGLRDGEAYSREDVQRELMSFVGVGQKVADCVALFSLDQADVIPVDTHVWRIACRDLDPSLLQAKSLTPAVYERVGKLFRDKFPEKSGWAHSLLFAAELPAFKPLLPPNLQREMTEFKDEEKRRNAEKKEEKKKSLTLKLEKAQSSGGGSNGDGEEESGSNARTELAKDKPTKTTTGGDKKLTKRSTSTAEHVGDTPEEGETKKAAAKKEGVLASPLPKKSRDSTKRRTPTKGT